MSTILPGLLLSIGHLNKEQRAYPGSVVITAVCEYDYAQLGQLIGEMHILWSVLGISWGPDRPFVFSDFDHVSGFEEFVCVLVEHLLDRLCAYDDSVEDQPRCIDQHAIDRLSYLFAGAVSDTDIHDRSIGIVLSERN